ncbi:MAG: inositol monophosphatase [Acidimicrobiia bacterium]|nr:inositol monophosphatase [Acidimicrobiia bacterium]
MTTDPNQLLHLALRIVDELVPTLVSARNAGGLAVHTKTSGTDMVTEMDRWCEERIIEMILSDRPTDGFLGEEGGRREGTSPVVWIIDPIDGTTNYLYDVPGYSVSIAAEIHGEVTVGVVADPVRREVHSAIRGRGASRNGMPIRCSNKADPATALVGTGFGYQPERRVEQARVLTGVIGRVRDIRRMGGAALDLCAVAGGRLDAYYESGLNPWDIAAGGLIALEAGARVTDLDGQPSWTDTVVCAAAPLHDSFRQLLVTAHS